MPLTEPILYLRNAPGQEGALTFVQADSNFVNLRAGLMNLVSQVDSNKANANSSISSLSGRMTSAEGSIYVLQNNTSSNTVTIQLQGQRISTLETSDTNKQTRIAALELTSADHENRLDALELEVTTDFNDLEGQIVATNGRIDTLETNTNTTLLDHENRLDSAETTITSHGTRITALEQTVVSPFNYRGSVAGGTQGSPFDLSTLTAKSNGDYYRVSASGYFTDPSSVTHYLNAQDAFIFVGTSIEKFDNTDTVVSAGSSDVSVTGDTDSGFSVDLSTSIKTKIDKVDTIETNTNNNTTEIAGHESRLDAIEPVVSGHTTELSDHETRIGTLETTVSSNVADIGLIQTDLSEKTTTISDHESRLDSIEPVVSGHTTDIGTLQTTVSGHTTDIGTLQTTVSGHTTELSDHETRIGTLESKVLQYADSFSGRVDLTTTTNNQVLDTTSKLTYRSVKYSIQIEIPTEEAQASEVLVVWNGANVYISEIATLKNGPALATFSADFNGNLVELHITPTHVNTTITFVKTAIKRAVP